MVRRPADEDRGSFGTGQEEELLSAALGEIGAEAAMEELQGLVGDSSAPGPIDTERAKLGGHPSRAYAQQQASLAELLNRSHPLCGRQRSSIGQNQHAHSEADLPGGTGGESQGRQRVEIVTARALGVVGRNGEVVVHPERVEALAFGDARALTDQVGCGGGAGVLEQDAELHGAAILTTPRDRGNDSRDLETWR